MKFKYFIKKKYITYGLSILFGRGIEYLIILFLAGYVSKSIYGEYEFYKKTIEMLSIFISFGTPSLIFTYSKSDSSKVNFLLFSIVTSISVSIIVLFFLAYFNFTFLWLPLLFYSLFFYSNSIFQIFNLVKNGSNQNAIYKIIVSFLFNVFILFFIIYEDNKEKALIYAATLSLFLSIPFFIIVVYRYWKENYFQHYRRYLKLFINVLYGSFTLVLNNFINIAFLTTDIFIIKVFTHDIEKSNILIANYSFPLTIAGALLIIPLTISQVEVERVKTKHTVIFEVIKKILILTLIGSILLFGLYFILINYKYNKFNDTIFLFIIILFAKIFQAISVPFGMVLLIKRKYNLNLKINLFILFFNVILSSIAFSSFGLYGIATISLMSLGIRLYLYKKYFINEI